MKVRDFIKLDTDIDVYDDVCEELAEHVDEWISDDPWDFESREIGDIYMAYEDDDPDLYDLLPVEAQLFTD